MRKSDDAGNLLAAKVLPIGLLFVSAAAFVRVIQESGQHPTLRLIGSLLGPFATCAVLTGMAVIAAIWFLHGDIAFPFRKIVALALVGLPTAMLFGVLQPPALRQSWGGIAGANLGTAVSFLPDTLAAGLSVLLLILCMVIAWRMAFGGVPAPRLAAGFAGITPPVSAHFAAEPLASSAVLEAEPLVRPAKSQSKPEVQSTLFDTLAEREAALRAAEEAANAPLPEETASATTTEVPPWLARSTPAVAAEPAAETETATATATEPLPAAAAPVADAESFGAGVFSEEDLDDVSDLKPLEEEDTLSGVEELEASGPAATPEAAAALAEDLEEEELLAEDSAGDYTIEDDLDAELETPVAVMQQPVTEADDEFSLAAADMNAPQAMAAPDAVEATAPAEAVTMQPVFAMTTEPVHATMAVLEQETTARGESAPVEEGVMLMHPALLALSAGTEEAVEESPAAAAEEAHQAVLVESVNVPEPVALLSESTADCTMTLQEEPEADAVLMEADPATDEPAALNEEEWTPRPMMVSDSEEVAEDLELGVAELEDAESILEAEAVDAPVAADSEPVDAPLFAMEPEVVTQPVAVTGQVTAAADEEAQRPMFTLLRGGAEPEPAPVEVPAHLASAALGIGTEAVVSEPPAKPKHARKPRQTGNWASWEDGAARPKRGSRSEPAEEAGQTLLFTTDQEPDADLLRRAEQIVVAEQRCSELMLQRKLELSWSVASRIVEHLERTGVVGAASAAGRREVLRREESASDNGF